MTNDKDLFSQINDLFEDVTVDQASDLIGEELAPSQSDYEKELIEKLNKNEFQLSDSLVEEIKENIEQGGEVDKTLTQYLRQKFGLAAPEPQQLTEDVLEAPQQVEDKPEKPVREDYIAQYADGLSSVVQRDAMRTTWNSPDDPHMRGDLHERMDALTAQLGILRASLTEQTMVSGIGQGGDGQSPGSGEVRINRMDDVNLGPDGISGLNPGDVLVWDPECNKGEGCWTPKPGDEIGTDTTPVFGKIWSCRSLQSPGTLYWGTNSDFINNVKTNLVYDGVQSIEYCMAPEDYEDNGNGTYTGAWVAFGATSNGTYLLDSAYVTTNGTSGVNGPEGFYLLGAPCGTGDGTEDCEPGFGTIFGCTKFTEDQPAQLTYGSKDQQELGGGTAITSGPGTDKVVEILRVFSECPQADNTGDWVCLYNYIDDAGDIKQGQALVTGKDGPLDNGFYGLGGECADNSGGGDQTERPMAGYISGCKKTADAEAPIKWGTEEQAEAGTGVSVTSPDTMAKEILLVIGNEIADDFTGEWTIWYVDKDGKQDTVTYTGGPSSIVGPEGAYLETDNCADGLPTGECGFAFGKKTGCDQVNAGGDLTWGKADDYTNKTGDVVASDAKKIHVVYSSCVDESNVGEWTCVYEDINGDMLAVVSPVNTESSPEYGFFIAGDTCDGDESGDGRPDNLKIGITTGCKELTAGDEGPLFWGTKEDYASGTGTDTGKIGVAIEFVYSLNANGDNTGDWNIVYRRSTNNPAVAVTTVSGTSPAEGAYLVGDCETAGGGECEGNNIIGDSNDCIRVTVKGNLYWGETPVDPDTDVRELVDTEVTQIVAIVGKNVCSNMWGEWYCFYKKGANSSVQVTKAYEGINPEESFYLTPGAGGECAPDGIDTEPPQQIRPEFGQAIGCYHSQPLSSTESSNVYWADIQSAIELDNGDQKTTTGDIREIVSIFSFKEVDSNGDREWTCIYQKFDGDYGFVVHTGKSPEGGFYLDTPNCVGDPDEITPGEDLVDFIRFGRPVGCDETLTGEDETGNLYFGNIVAIADGDDGQVIDPEGNVQALHFSFTLDKQFSHWNLFYEKSTGTAFIQYPDPAGGTYRSFPWGFHIVDGVCANDELPEPEEPIEGNGKPIEGIYPGCKATETVGGKPLYWGTKEDAQTGGGVNVSDIEGNPVLDAVRIISTFSFNADNTRYGTWFTIYKKEPVGGDTTYGIATKVGRSPQSGFFIFTDECDGDGILPGGECELTKDCPDGMICVGDRCVLKPCVIDDECDGDCIFGYCYNLCPPEGCPDGFECVENPLKPGNLVCAPNGGFPGGGEFPQCGEDNDCPPGYQCVGGFCVQLPCSSDGSCPDDMTCVFGHCYKPCDPTDSEACPPGFSCVEAFPGTFICVLGSWPPGGEIPDPPPGGGDCAGGCPPGYTCVGDLCVLLPCPETGCPSGFKCVGGHCFPECDPLDQNSCQPGFECVENPLEPGNYICLPGGELPGGSCTEDDDCPPGYFCGPDGLCIPKPCVDDGTSCGLVNGRCYEGFCYERCDDDNPCPPGFICVDPDNDGDTICMPIGGGGGNCSADLDCNYGYVCVDGNCIPKRCDGIVTDPEIVCGPGLYCYDGVCYPKCENGYICPEGHICVNVGEEYICMPSGGGNGPNGCWDTTQCDPGYICFEGTCIPATCPPIGGEDCPEGTICVGGRCYQPCSDTEPCPDGYACVDISPGLPVCMPIGPDGGGDGGEDTHTLYFGYLPGCKTTGDTAAVLKFGDAKTPAGDMSLTSDAKSIIFSFAIDDGTENTSYNPDTGIGDWHCVYKDNNGNLAPIFELSDAGPSPLEGYYLDTLNCEDTEPEQPGANPEEISTQPIGCHKSEPACTLKWGTAEQVVDGSGTEVIDTNVEEILYTGYRNIYPNGFADQVVIYKKSTRATPLQAVRFFQNPDDEGTKGFYLDVVADGCRCVGTGEEHSPTLGLITGCREVSRNGSVYWGTKQDYSDLVNELITPDKTPATDLGVKAKAIIAVVSLDSDDTGLGNWDINYKTFSDEIKTTSYYGQSPDGGAFILPDEDSVCLLTGDSSRAVYTDEVILRKVDNLNEDKDTNFALKGGQSRPAFEHQDSANLYFSQEILDLNRLKPTMIVAEFTGDSDSDPQVAPDYGAEGIPFNYIPVQGDLWLDPTEDDKGIDNIMRAAIVDRTNFNPNNPQITDLKVEWVVVSGGGVGGGPGGPVTTDQVYLINTIKFYQAYNEISPTTLEDFTNYFPLITQEDANLVNIDMLKKLQELKPTIHITEEIYSVPVYAPSRGDLWIDPRDYTMYVCDYDVNNRPTISINTDNTIPYQDVDGNYLYWVEVSGSGGSGGNRVMIQMDPPDNAVEGDLWVDEADYLVYVYTPQGSWAALTGDQSAMGKKFSVWVNARKPEGKVEQGDLWFDTEDSEMRIFLGGELGNAWVPVSNGGVDRRKALYEESLFDMNKRIQDLNARLMSVEGNSNPMTQNFTYPIQSPTDPPANGGTVDPLNRY